MGSRGGRITPSELFPGEPMPRLYDAMIEVFRERHHSRTEKAYVYWIRSINIA